MKEGARVAGEKDGKTFHGKVLKVAGGKIAIELDAPIEGQDEMMMIWDRDSGWSLNESETESPTKFQRKRAEDEASAQPASESISEVLESYRELVISKQNSEDGLSDIKEKIQEAEHKILERLDVDNLTSCKHVYEDDVERLCYRHTVFQPTLESKEEFIAWCEGYGIDINVFGTWKWDNAKVRGFVKELHEEDKPIPSGIKVFEGETPRFRPSFNRKKGS